MPFSELRRFARRGVLSSICVAALAVAAPAVAQQTNNTNTNTQVVITATDFINNATIATADPVASVLATGAVGTVINSSTGVVSNTDPNFGAGYKFLGTVGTFINHGTVHSNDFYAVHFADDVTNIINYGSIWADTSTALGVSDGTNTATVANFVNFGTIGTATGSGVSMQGMNNGTFLNAAGATIIGREGIAAFGFDSFRNDGTIHGTTLRAINIGQSGTGPIGEFINTGRLISDQYNAVELWGFTSLFVNTGTIETFGTSEYGVIFVGDAKKAVNTGIIRASGTGFAMAFGTADNELIIGTGSELYGAVGFGGLGGADTFDFSGFYGTAVINVLSMTVDGTGNDTIVAGDRPWARIGAGAPVSGVTENHLIAIYDPTGATSMGTVVSDTVGAIRDVVASQFGGGTTGVSNTTIESAYVAGPDLGDAANATAVMSELDVGLSIDTRAWASAFGGFSADGAPVALTNLYGGLVAGAHTAIAEQTLLGALVAYSRSSFSVATDEQTIVSDTGVVGLYGESDLGTVKLDFSLYAGGALHNSSRRVVVVNALQTATASFSSWFISPGIGLEMPLLSDDGMQVNVAAATSAILGGVSGYTETIPGGGGVTVGGLPIAIWEGRVELNAEKVIGATDAGDITFGGKVGLMAQANFGGSTLPISFGGIANQNAPYVVPNSAAFGAYAGMSLKAAITEAVDATFDAHGSVRTDGVVGYGVFAAIGGSF